MKQINKNDDIQLEITGLTAEGSGIGRYEGMAVFVAGAAVGDVAEVHIIKVSKKYAVGKINRLLTPSPDRTAPACPVYSQCGGCVFSHMTYESELEAKWSRVNDAVRRIGHLEITPEPIVGADAPERYRNKSQLPVKIEGGVVSVGYYAQKSHRIINCTDCLLQPAAFKAGIEAFKTWAKSARVSSYDETTGKGLIRHFYLRKAFGTNEIMACVVINATALPKEQLLVDLLREALPGLKSVVVNINMANTNVILGKTSKTVWGADFLTDELLGMKFRISPNSFYQVNHDQTEKLYTIVKESAALTGSEVLADIYCGAGTIGLTLAKDAKQLIGLEIVPQAVENAKMNAEINNIKNAHFFCCDAQEGAKELIEKSILPDVVIIDPPRKGADTALIGAITEMHPKRIVYVSCDPATLARDLALFREQGYETKALTPVDLFPRTAHVETVAVLERTL